MKIDFHAHGSFSSILSFKLDDFQEMIAQAARIGLDAVALTDHFNAADYPLIQNTLDNEYPYRGECYLVNGIKVFPGMEVEIRKRLHLLVIGGKRAISAFYLQLKGHLSEEAYVDIRGFF